MNDAPPRYDVESGDSTADSELGILQTQVIALQRQVASLLEAQQNQFLTQKANSDPPIFDGKGWFREWYWKMSARLVEIKSLDEQTKINYIVSRLTGSAFVIVENNLTPWDGRPRFGTSGDKVVQTAEQLMQLLKKKYT